MKFLLMSSLIVLSVSLGYAAPAIPDDISFEQLDGSTFEGNLKGDEWFSWVEDKNGNIIKYNFDSKNYEYAIIEGTDSGVELIPSGIAVVIENHTNDAPADKVIVGDSTRKLLGDILVRKRNEALSEFIEEKKPVDNTDD